MKKRANLLILAFFFIACASFALAQPGGGQGRGPGGPGGPGRGPGGGPMMGGGPGMAALFSEEGRKDIGLSDKQVQDIQNAFRSMRPEPGERFPGPDATEAERKEFMERMGKRFGETIKKVEGVMTKEQLEKSRVRSFQAGGGFAGVAMNPFAQSALNLTDDQRAKIGDFQKEMGEKMRKFFEENRPSGPPEQMSQEERQAFFGKMQKFNEENRQEMEGKIKGILTDDQKKQGDKMLSETPEYIKEAIERGPGGPGGPGRGPGRGEYRPGADSWRPGQGAPPGGDSGEAQPKSRFPGRRN